MALLLGAWSWVKGLLREIELLQDTTLDAYLKQMQQWLDDENRPLTTLPPEDERRKMARIQTLTVLERLGPKRKRRVLQVLYEHRLILETQRVVDLREADLSGADLAKLHLVHSNLYGANLSGADLSEAGFCVFHITEAVAKAMQRGVSVDEFQKPDAVSNLENTNLKGTSLKGARLAGCNLISANFKRAKLEGTDLWGADLRLARNLKQRQINQAYGGAEREESTQDTLLPDGLQAPEAWKKSIHEQEQDREHRIRRRIARFLHLRN